MSSFNKNNKAVRSFVMAFLNWIKIYPLMKKGFFTNKYTLSVFILLAILATDILLHKGMSRVILPEKFTNKRLPQNDLSRCVQPLDIKGKYWIKAVNTPALATAVDSNANGIEMDVYFDTAKNCFFVYHDSAVISRVNAEEIFSVLQQRKLDIPVWLDFKNLFGYNGQQALAHLSFLRNKYNLHKKLLVESPNAPLLQAFCDSGFYTSFYTPFFNPYKEEEALLVKRIDSISTLLKKYPVSAISGYYFQTPFLKKFFPAFPILTWTDDSKVSIVNNVFNRQLEKDDHIQIILHNTDN